MVMNAPPVCAGKVKLSAPSLPVPLWSVPETTGSWPQGSAASPVERLHPRLVVLWMTMELNFQLDRSGHRVIPADGSVSCKRTDCLEACPHPIRIPGQCCPDCSAGCTYGGRIFYNNETFPSVLDPCLSCICLLGSVACSPVDCIVFCTYPFHPEGECCPVCHDCNYKGRKVVNGHNFVPEGEPCIHCTCQLGEVSCEKRPCPSICAEPFAPPTHCCPDCQGNEVTDDLASLENSLANSHLEDGESEAALQNLQRRSMALMSDRNCSHCTPIPTPASFSPEPPLAASDPSVWKIPPMSPTVPGDVGFHQTRPGVPISLLLNRPPSVKPSSSWLGHSMNPPIRPGSAMPLLTRPESIRPPPTRPSGFSSDHHSLPSLITRTTGTSVPSTAVYPSTPLTVANLRNSITALFQPSDAHSLPLPPPAKTLSPSVSPKLDSPQELSGSSSQITGSPMGQQTMGGNSSLTPGGENNLNSTAP